MYQQPLTQYQQQPHLIQSPAASTPNVEHEQRLKAVEERLIQLEEEKKRFMIGDQQNYEKSMKVEFQTGE